MKWIGISFTVLLILSIIFLLVEAYMDKSKEIATVKSYSGGRLIAEWDSVKVNFASETLCSFIDKNGNKVRVSSYYTITYHR